jgi:hypothetical protein
MHVGLDKSVHEGAVLHTSPCFPLVMDKGVTI